SVNLSSRSSLNDDMPLPNMAPTTMTTARTIAGTAPLLVLALFHRPAPTIPAALRHVSRENDNNELVSIADNPSVAPICPSPFARRIKDAIKKASGSVAYPPYRP